MPAAPTVATLMTSPARTVRAEDSLFQAAEAMWGGDCGGVPVVDGEGRLAGFVTDRDIAMCAAIQGRTLHELPVTAAMTFGAVGVAEDADLAAAHGLLRTHRVRRLPVLDATGVVVGLLSLADLVRDAARHPKQKSRGEDLRATIELLARPWSEISPLEVSAVASHDAAPVKLARKAAAPKAERSVAARRSSTQRAAGNRLAKRVSDSGKRRGGRSSTAGA